MKMLKSKFLNHIIFTSILIAVWSYSYLKLNGFEEDTLRVLIRWSAKIAACFFAIAFGSSSLDYFVKMKWTKTLVYLRPLSGLTFFTFHSFHLGFLVLLQVCFHPVFTMAKTTSLLAGGLAYLFIFLMTFTTFPTIRRKISFRNWKLLHTTGAYWIWIIFANSYFKNVINKQQYYFLLVLFMVVILLRLARIIHKRFLKST